MCATIVGMDKLMHFECCLLFTVKRFSVYFDWMRGLLLLAVAVRRNVLLFIRVNRRQQIALHLSFHFEHSIWIILLSISGGNTKKGEEEEETTESE